jgi:hypothetical protein
MGSRMSTLSGYPQAKKGGLTCGAELLAEFISLRTLNPSRLLSATS